MWICREDYFAHCQKKVRDLDLRNVEFIHGRAESVLLEGEFDCIVSDYLAKYVDLDLLVGHAWRMLRPGGSLVMHELTSSDAAVIRGPLDAHFKVLQAYGRWRRPEWGVAFNDVPALLARTRWVDELTQALRAHQFSNIEIENQLFGASSWCRLQKIGRARLAATAALAAQSKSTLRERWVMGLLGHCRRNRQAAMTVNGAPVRAREQIFAVAFRRAGGEPPNPRSRHDLSRSRQHPEPTAHAARSGHWRWAPGNSSATHQFGKRSQRERCRSGDTTVSEGNLAQGRDISCHGQARRLGSRHLQARHLGARHWGQDTYRQDTWARPCRVRVGFAGSGGRARTSPNGDQSRCRGENAFSWQCAQQYRAHRTRSARHQWRHRRLPRLDDKQRWCVTST